MALAVGILESAVCLWFKQESCIILLILSGCAFAGPFKVNGVPLRRVNQAYVIATSTKLDITSVDVTKYADAYFKREVTKKKKGESEFFEAEKEV